MVEHPTIIEHNHIKIRLLFCIYNTSTLKYHIKTYTYCNNCAEKLEPMVQSIYDIIPDIVEPDVITKVICNVLTNGYEYEWFGHREDRDFYINNGDKW